MLAAAALLFAAVFALRVAITDTDQLVTLFYALPIALVAVELGLAWGLTAAAMALGLFGLWDVTWARDVPHNFHDYSAGGAAFLLLGGSIGAIADRLREVSAQSTRFWELSADLLCTAGFDGYFQRLNPSWEATLGWSQAELRARPFVALVHPDDRERTVAETGRPHGHRGRDGRLREPLPM